MCKKLRPTIRLDDGIRSLRAHVTNKQVFSGFMHLFTTGLLTPMIACYRLRRKVDHQKDPIVTSQPLYKVSIQNACSGLVSLLNRTRLSRNLKRAADPALYILL